MWVYNLHFLTILVNAGGKCKCPGRHGCLGSDAGPWNETLPDITAPEPDVAQGALYSQGLPTSGHVTEIEQTLQVLDL